MGSSFRIILIGLIQASKKNMERVAEAVPDCDDRALQRFLTNSTWEDQRVVEQITHDANSLLGGHVGSCLIIDESAMPKKGKNSVSVSRQWCGQLGKTANYQVGVYSILCRCDYAVPIGFRLFLPQCWIDAKMSVFPTSLSSSKANLGMPRNW